MASLSGKASVKWRTNLSVHKRSNDVAASEIRKIAPRFRKQPAARKRGVISATGATTFASRATVTIKGGLQLDSELDIAGQAILRRTLCHFPLRLLTLHLCRERHQALFSAQMTSTSGTCTSITLLPPFHRRNSSKRDEPWLGRSSPRQRHVANE